MTKKENLAKGLMAHAEEEEKDLQVFEEATDRVIKKKKESRTQQFVALLPPSVHRDLMDASEGTGLSANEIVNRLLEDYIAEHQKEILKGKKIREIKES